MSEKDKKTCKYLEHLLISVSTIFALVRITSFVVRL